MSRSCLLKKIFEVHLNYKLWLFFDVVSRKHKKEPWFDILIAITLELNLITKEMSTYFSSTLWALSVSLFHLSIPRPSKSNFRGPHFFYVLVCNIHIYLTFMFYFQFDTFSTNSGSGLTRLQLEKFFRKNKIDTWKLPLESKN